MKFKNYILEGDTVNCAKVSDMEHAREQCRALTGSVIMPAIIYKGRVIPSGEFGERSLENA
jgi:hypothetical protein